MIYWILGWHFVAEDMNEFISTSYKTSESREANKADLQEDARCETFVVGEFILLPKVLIVMPRVSLSFAPHT